MDPISYGLVLIASEFEDEDVQITNWNPISIDNFIPIIVLFGVVAAYGMEEISI